MGPTAGDFFLELIDVTFQRLHRQLADPLVLGGVAAEGFVTRLQSSKLGSRLGEIGVILEVRVTTSIMPFNVPNRSATNTSPMNSSKSVWRAQYRETASPLQSTQP
jgi:hypothetical protein